MKTIDLSRFERYVPTPPLPKLCAYLGYPYIRFSAAACREWHLVPHTYVRLYVNHQDAQIAVELTRKDVDGAKRLTVNGAIYAAQLLETFTPRLDPYIERAAWIGGSDRFRPFPVERYREDGRQYLVIDTSQDAATGQEE